MILMGCSGNPNLSKGGLPTDRELLIENGINRGTRYTDSKGTDRIITYIPVAITNDEKTPIHLQIEFLNGYDYPDTESHEEFKLTVLPEEWTKPISPTKNMIDKLKTPELTLNKIIKPGEKIIAAIGTIRRVPTKCSPIPNVLFIKSDDETFQSCVSLMDQDKSTRSQRTLGVKLGYCDNRCILIPCGKVSFLPNSIEENDR